MNKCIRSFIFFSIICMPLYCSQRKTVIEKYVIPRDARIKALQKYYVDTVQENNLEGVRKKSFHTDCILASLQIYVDGYEACIRDYTDGLSHRTHARIFWFLLDDTVSANVKKYYLRNVSQLLPKEQVMHLVHELYALYEKKFDIGTQEDLVAIDRGVMPRSLRQNKQVSSIIHFIERFDLQAPSKTFQRAYFVLDKFPHVTIQETYPGYIARYNSTERFE